MTADHQPMNPIHSLSPEEKKLCFSESQHHFHFHGLCPDDRSERWKKRKDRNMIKIYSHSSDADAYHWCRGEAIVRTDVVKALSYFYNEVEELPILIDALSDLRVLERKGQEEMVVSIKSKTVFPISPRTATISAIYRRLSQQKAEVILRDIPPAVGGYSGPLLKRFVSKVMLEQSLQDDNMIKVTQYMYIDPGLPVPSGVLEPIMIQVGYNFLQKVTSRLEQKD